MRFSEVSRIKIRAKPITELNFLGRLLKRFIGLNESEISFDIVVRNFSDNEKTLETHVLNKEGVSSIKTIGVPTTRSPFLDWWNEDYYKKHYSDDVEFRNRWEDIEKQECR